MTIETLGERRFPSPLHLASASHPDARYFRDDRDLARPGVCAGADATGGDTAVFEEAGPRSTLFFDPTRTTAAVVTCGGLSPGLNNVVRSLYAGLTESYGVPRVLGIRNGFLGMNPACGPPPIELTRDLVQPLDKLGGTMLGSSRGPQDPSVMADFIDAARLDILFCIGGDGTQRGALALSDELRRRGRPVAVVGIPKTIDNDIPFVRLSFGYATALEKGADVIRAAHAEAEAAVNGIALVKLMGRHAGFIAAGATVVSQEVDFALVPEVEFPLDGESGLLHALERRLGERSHAVVVAAEGAGQHLFTAQSEIRDASGNLQHHDVLDLLRREITAHFAERRRGITIKCLDPSYYIRSVPASTYDRLLCDQLARHAVHAAMAGKSSVMIGFENNQYLHIPIRALAGKPKRMDVSGDLWRAVLETTGQPRW